MASSAPTPPPNKRPSSLLRPRFTVGTLMVAMILFSVVGAAVYYGARAVDAGVRFEGMVVVLVICAPPLLLLTMKVAYTALRWINRQRDE